VTTTAAAATACAQVSRPERKPMFIVDSQIHVWKEESADRPWVPGARERIRLNGHREEAFSYQEALELMDAAGVDRALLLPPSWEGDRIDYSLEACAAHPDRFGIMARIPQNKPAEGAAMMRDLAQNPHVKGTRLTFHRPIDRNWMIDGTNDWYWPLAEELGLRTMVHAPIWKAELGTIAARHPGLTLIIDHIGDHGPVRRRRHRLLGQGDRRPARAPQHPREGVGHPGLLDAPVPERQHRQVRPGDDRRHGADGGASGATDLTRLMGHGLTYTDTITQFTEHFGFTDDELEWIMGRGISECLGWPVPERARVSG